MTAYPTSIGTADATSITVLRTLLESFFAVVSFLVVSIDANATFTRPS